MLEIFYVLYFSDCRPTTSPLHPGVEVTIETSSDMEVTIETGSDNSLM